MRKLIKSFCVLLLCTIIMSVNILLVNASELNDYNFTDNPVDELVDSDIPNTNDVENESQVMKKTADKPNINYQTHLSMIGWQNAVSNGEESGTTGKKTAIEAIKISLDNNEYNGNIEYRVHANTLGWLDTVSNGEIAGTVGQGLDIQAIEISLTGELADKYDIYYRVHSMNYGWLGWEKNGQTAGTTGISYRMEAIQIMLLSKDDDSKPISNIPAYITKGNVTYNSHLSYLGWQQNVSNGAVSGSTGKGIGIESIHMFVKVPNISGGIRYSAHVEEVGWQNYVQNSEYAGTVGERKSIQAIKIELTGEIAKYYNVYYRAHSQEYGWLGWTRNGAPAGTTKINYRMEAIQIMVLPLDSADSPSMDGFAYTETPIITVPPSNTGQRIVELARAHIGKPYVWGGNGPSSFDCSGLTKYVHNQLGITIPRTSSAQAGQGAFIANGQWQPGDLIFYSSSSGGGVNHVAIYIGNGQIIHAANPQQGVRYDPVNIMYYKTARRYW